MHLLKEKPICTTQIWLYGRVEIIKSKDVLLQPAKNYIGDPAFMEESAPVW